MRNQVLLAFVFVFLSFQGFSQVHFEKGYFIDESGERQDILIKNSDWKNNPSQFEYKLSEDAPVQTAGISEVKEFGVPGSFKHVRATVEIDKSADALRNLTSDRNPDFQEETLFLEVLLEGEASLYSYRDSNLRRYFYSILDSPIKQLIYKSYLINYGKEVAENNSFRQQLSLELKCEAEPDKNFEFVGYNKSDLKKVFVNYNDCTNSEYAVFEQEQKRDIFNISLRPGINFSSLAVKNERDRVKNTDFGSKINYRLGIELEFVLPYNRNKWAVIIEPTYQYFTAEESFETDKILGGRVESDVDYKSIELPVGIRHYFFLNENSKIFADVSYIFEHSGDSKIVIAWYNGTLQENLEIKSKPNLGFGLGYQLNDFSISGRYHLNRKLLNYVFWDANYETFSLILGYRIF